jgi:hypothetical protein
MKGFIRFILVGLLVIIATACSNGSKDANSTEIEGPAFVLFYTDN